MSKSVDEFREEIADMDEPKGDYPETWEPQTKGETLVGEVRNYRESVGPNNQPVLEIASDHKGVVSIWVTKILKDKLENAGIVYVKGELRGKGEIIGIKYFGKKQSERSGREYKVWGVRKLDEEEAEKESSSSSGGSMLSKGEDTREETIENFMEEYGAKDKQLSNYVDVNVKGEAIDDWRDAPDSVLDELAKRAFWEKEGEDVKETPNFG